MYKHAFKHTFVLSLCQRRLHVMVSVSGSCRAADRAQV